MSFGAILQFEGYPPIDISTWKPYITMGCYCMSYRSTYKPYAPGHGEVVENFEYPVSVPAEADVHISGSTIWFSGRTWYKGKNGRVVNDVVNNQASVGFFPFSAEGDEYLYGPCISGIVYSAVADLTNAVSSASFGFSFIGENGIDAAFNNIVPPLSVLSRRTFAINASDSVVEYDLPELNIDMRGAKEFVVYVGTKENKVGVFAQIVPKDWVNSKGFESGAVLRCSYFPANSAHASVQSYSGSVAGVSSELLVLVAGKPAESPQGYGIAIFNDSEKLTFAPNCVPVMPKSVVYNKPLAGPNKFLTNMLGEPDPLTDGFAADDTILIPAGLNAKYGLRVLPANQRTYYIGYAVAWVTSGEVRTTLLWNDTSNAYSANSYTTWSVFTNEWSSYMTRQDPIPLVRANDYFINI
ncbi:hypothetical protein [Vibrio navarrensis]|uniref:hypothetical protein n=1 Tax=Vibrio navarrensis TaxID=29495 RepID=UPI001558C92A|nr:hypothetical protein [Vibrio navarrensis]